MNLNDLPGLAKKHIYASYLAGLFFVFICFFLFYIKKTQIHNESAMPIVATVTPIKQASPPVADPSISPTPSPPSRITTNKLIQIAQPKENEIINDGFLVMGTITGNTQLYYRVIGQNSGQLALGPVSYRKNSESNAFSFKLQLTGSLHSESENGKIEIYSINGNDTENEKSSVNVIIQNLKK